MHPYRYMVQLPSIDSINPSKTATMTDQLSSATNGSVLLSSGLSSHVMAKQVIGFLELKDILNCLAVEGLKTHFHLEKYYCEEHGSKLESQVERRQEHIEEQDVEDKDNDNRGVTKNDADKGAVECEDCVEREFGYDRCPECNTFAHEEEIDCCNSCKGKCCHYCDKLEMGFCEGCNSNYCRVKFCPLVEYCDGCDSCWMPTAAKPVQKRFVANARSRFGVVLARNATAGSIMGILINVTSVTRLSAQKRSCFNALNVKQSPA
ncbi:expressed unknown protein [Seminavis robusta]|uniref:Uncharacterized protein n=1 Tax=Seminavis robusta TaxID=568900 RepID=A0A9N8EQ15_9STRA|nr:expressed unknown protein [Seminavis robusta]|eukprot:Sro1377_g267510.1 n/a (263) ;mRNA; f:6636-7714